MEPSLNIEKFENWGLTNNLTNRGMLHIAGPCSAESEDQIMQTALALSKYGVDIFRAGLWKPRTRPNTFEGVGVKGLKWLKKAAAATGMSITVEVATPEHVERCLKHEIDVLWIGARTTSNPFSIQAIAESLRGVDIPVMVKNPISPDIELWIGAFERLNRVGITRLAAIHRGFSSSVNGIYRNSPNWRIPIELRRRIPRLPIICDPSHICGKRELLFSVAQKAVDLLYSGLMIEVHTNPDDALSDREQQITPDEFNNLIVNLKPKKVSTNRREYRLHITHLRKRIDEIDYRIIKLLAKRMGIVSEIGLYKKKHGISILQPGRWDDILKNRIKIGADNRLAKEFIQQIYHYIHEEAIRHQGEV